MAGNGVVRSSVASVVGDFQQNIRMARLANTAPTNQITASQLGPCGLGQLWTLGKVPAESLNSRST
jgi:hypothetical protein